MDSSFIKINNLNKILGSGTYGVVSIIDKNSVFKSFKTKNQSKYEEITILQSINHPNIVSYLGIGIHDSDIGIILERCEMILDDYLNMPVIENVNDYPLFSHNNKSRYKFRKADYIDACYQLLSGISFLHRSKITHGDIKGNNIMIKDGRLVYCDFGMSIRGHASGKRSLEMCATIEWRPLDIIYLSHNGQFETIIGTITSKLQMFCEDVQEHHDGIIELYQVDIYSVGLIMLAILCGKPQPHSTLDDPDIYSLLKKWHINCSTRTLPTIRNYLKHIEGWHNISGMSSLISRMVTSSPWLRYNSIQNALDHEIFTRNGYIEPIDGIYHPFSWEITNTKIDTRIIKKALIIFGSSINVTSRTVNFIAEGIIHLIGYLHYINFLRNPIIKRGSPYMIENYKLNNKIATDEYLIDVSVTMTFSVLFGNENFELSAKRSKYLNMFDDYFMISRGNMFLTHDCSTSSIKRLAPLGFYLTNHDYKTITEYIIEVERGNILNIFKDIAIAYGLNESEKNLTLIEYNMLINDIIYL